MTRYSQTSHIYSKLIKSISQCSSTRLFRHCVLRNLKAGYGGLSWQTAQDVVGAMSRRFCTRRADEWAPTAHLEPIRNAFTDSTNPFSQVNIEVRAHVNRLAKKILSSPLFTLLAGYSSSTASPTDSKLEYVLHISTTSLTSSVTFAVNIAVAVIHESNFIISTVNSARRQ